MMILNSEINGSYETSCSTEINNLAKRARYEAEDDDAGGSQKFKGIVPQQNGHWGAQIYANHQRIWLGTFKSERDAAMAYDSATVKLRSGESHRNFPWNDQTVQEPLFQSHYSMETILSMIKNGTYQSKFATFLRNQTQSGIVGVNKGGGQQFCCTQLFQKELTPSDVGKLNRLVIPKKHAVTYFPLVCSDNNNNNNNNITANDDNYCTSDVELVFYDKLMRLWRFRYCYWKSSQSYVFTRGWNRFVKDKKLKAKDTIVFYMCEPINFTKGGDHGQPFTLIDVIYNNAGHGKKHSSEDHNNKGEDAKQVLEKRLISSEVDGEETQGRIDLNVFHSTHNNNVDTGFKLFGVNIS
ncbi:AP2/B3 transcription factor family protein [Trifolium repens]|nr:AP2/B3 transcription factor family protein [Trifolium repens]